MASSDSGADAAAATVSVGSKRGFDSTAAGSNSGSSISMRRVQPRHFHSGPNPIAGEVPQPFASAAATASIPAADVLYTHALESIFAFATLAELAVLMCVSKKWRAAVLSMGTLGFHAVAYCAQIALMCASPLRRHVSSMKAWLIRGDIIDINCIASYLPYLEQLEVTLRNHASPRYSPSLRSLTLACIGLEDDGALQRSINAIPALPHLERLVLDDTGDTEPTTLTDAVSFAPLVGAPQLTALELGNLLLSHAHAQQLRNVHGLQHFRSFFGKVPVSTLFAAPIPFKHLTSLEIFIHTAADADALSSLVSLSTLSVLSCFACNMDFLLEMASSLRSLHIGYRPPEEEQAEVDWDTFSFPDIDVPHVVNLLQACTHLTNLTVDGDCGFKITSKQLESCVERMSHLASLALRSHRKIRSLAFLDSGTLPHTLTSLSITDNHGRIPLDELHTMHKLRFLRSLRLSASNFSKHLPRFTQKLYSPPSLLFPLLTEFDFF
jgi:hypothetical protein